MSRPRATALLRAGAVLAALLALGPLGARAGDRRLELVVADMSPDGTRPECMRAVVRALRHDDANVHRIGGPRVRQLVGDEEGDFLAWERDALDPVVRVLREDVIDAIALVDCRAEAGTADVWVSSPTGGVARLRLRETEIDDARAEWLARTIHLQAWAGFVP